MEVDRTLDNLNDQKITVLIKIAHKKNYLWVKIIKNKIFIN